MNIERPNIRITKNRDFGIKDFIPCSFDPCNRRIFQSDTGDKVVYGWDHTGIQVPENAANTLKEFEIQSGDHGEQPF